MIFGMQLSSKSAPTNPGTIFSRVRSRPKPALLLQRYLREHRRETGGHCRRRLVTRQAEHQFRTEPVVWTVGVVSDEKLVRCRQHLRYPNLGVGHSCCLLKDSDCTETFEVTWYRLMAGLVRDKEPPWQLQFLSEPIQSPYFDKRASPSFLVSTKLARERS